MSPRGSVDIILSPRFRFRLVFHASPGTVPAIKSSQDIELELIQSHICTPRHTRQTLSTHAVAQLGARTSRGAVAAAASPVAQCTHAAPLGAHTPWGATAAAAALVAQRTHAAAPPGARAPRGAAVAAVCDTASLVARRTHAAAPLGARASRGAAGACREGTSGGVSCLT